MPDTGEKGIPSLGHSLYKGILFTSSHFIPARPSSLLICPLHSLPSTPLPCAPVSPPHRTCSFLQQTRPGPQIGAWP